MGVLAIVVNCYLIAQCGQLQRLFPWLSPEGAIISVVVLEVRRSLRYCRVSRCAALSGPRFPPHRGVHLGEEDAQRAPPVPPQHFALLLKYVIQVAIPDIPAWVAEEMAKLEYQRREAFKVGDADGVKGGGDNAPLGAVHGAGTSPRGAPVPDALPVGRSTSARRSTTSSSSSGASGRRRSGSGTPSTRPARSASPAATRPSPRPPGRTRPTRRARARGKAPGAPRTAPTSPSAPARCWPPTTS